MKEPQVKERNSNLELFRIITMLVIVAHHYVVNSGLEVLINQDTTLSFNNIFLLLFGWGGKTGINCFVMITGYFMCKSTLTVRRYLKLLLEVLFYRIVFYIVFMLSGYFDFGIIGFFKAITGFTSISTGFTSSFLVFYLFIPFLNILTNNMNKKMHLLLIALCLGIHTVLPSLRLAAPKFSYVSWFMIIYLIAAYLRIHPDKHTENNKLWTLSMFLCLLASILSVIAGAVVEKQFGTKSVHYFFVADSNKILALLTAVSAFMFFKNLNIPQSKLINKIAASTFGVLLIHAANDSMRTWLWGDFLKNTNFYNSEFLVLHAIGTVILIYIVCTLIDMLRIKFIEKPLFKKIDKYLK